ncbi:hypothetical protein CC86DRAFT_369687 [Ophiobolus disseminans]|uniref:Uncharacterized protein n=1 Tax=Ophiobolus disseminans TaxID=1469910 RepID=A0A6A7A449_9PLEO|nr:hypothetical protein CC86DRAFT_369687 [Ophiobolus disseminans]
MCLGQYLRVICIQTPISALHALSLLPQTSWPRPIPHFSSTPLRTQPLLAIPFLQTRKPLFFHEMLAKHKTAQNNTTPTNAFDFRHKMLLAISS